MYKSVPDESFFSRLKFTFESDFANLFDSMVLKFIDICEDINNNLPYAKATNKENINPHATHAFLSKVFLS